MARLVKAWAVPGKQTAVTLDLTSKGESSVETGAVAETMIDGYMRLTIWADGHRDWGLIEVVIPRSISAELAGYILANGSNLMRQVARAHVLDDAYIVWDTKSCPSPAS